MSLEHRHRNMTFHMDDAKDAEITISYHGEKATVKASLLSLIGPPEGWNLDHGGSAHKDLYSDVSDVCDDLIAKVKHKEEVERDKAKKARERTKGGGKKSGGGGFSLGSLMKK